MATFGLIRFTCVAPAPFKPSPHRFTCACFTSPLCLYLAFVLSELVLLVPLPGKLRNLRLRTWNSSPSPKTDFRACILDNYAYSHESGHLWKIAGFLVNVSVELWYFWEYMGQSWNMWHPTAVVAQVIRQIIPRLFFA